MIRRINNKRKIRNSRLRGDHYLPMIVSISILLTWQGFHFSMFYTGGTMQCITLSEAWMHPKGEQWPLFGSFSLAFMLVFIWNFSIVFTREARAVSDKIILLANALVLVAIGLIMVELMKTTKLEHYREQGAYLNWFQASQNPYPAPGQCELAKPFVGVWNVRVVYKDRTGPEFPFERIQFKRDLTFLAIEPNTVKPVEDYWVPSSKWSSGFIYTLMESQKVWYMQIDGDDLVLISNEDAELPMTKVLLNRSEQPIPRGW